VRMTTRLLLILATAALPLACRESPVTGPITHLPRDLTAGEQQLVSSGNRFAFALFRAITAQEPADSNLFISPLSVGMALGMTVNGAAGATRDSMLHALQLDGLPMDEVNRGYRGVIDLLRGLDRSVEFTLANSIWYRAGIAVGPAFLDDARTWFDAAVRGLDFASPTAPTTINAWVSEQTRGKIPTIVDNIPDTVIMYLINAIYFKGSWTQQFDAALTHDAPFTLRGGGTVSARMMEHKDPAPARLYAAGGATVVDLPYGGRAWAMTIVLPSSAAGIDSLVAGLTQERWDGWMAGLDSGGVIVTMPKFKLTFERQMKPYLEALGMGIAFSCGAADFTPLYPARGQETCITRVKHKTYVDVYEEGTEAAAVTSVEVGVTSVGPGPLHIVVDRPFVVAIRERLTGTILFLGRVMNPVAS
jgi:serine protease inhibitor